MRVFWSWQSDRPGHISRHFVREALQLAINELNESPEIQEAQREVTLDHDRKGVPGSPDLANVIFEKVKASDVFVADVTPVGKTDATPPKRLINANVAIELGYALATLGDRKLIMVMNEHYGNRDHLPFDLRHKAGPVGYHLAPLASKEENKQAKKQLTGALKVALREMLTVLKPTMPVFEPRPSVSDDPSRYFDPTKTLVNRAPLFGRGDPQILRAPTTPLLYLRVMPTKTMAPLGRADAIELVRKGPLHLDPFYYHRTGASFESNEYGAIAFDANYEDGVILCAAQLFLNQELWAFNATLLDPSPDRASGLPTCSIEQTFAVMLPGYLKFVQEKLGVEPPIRIEAGGSGLLGYVLFMPSNFVEKQWGPLVQDNVIWSGTLKSVDPPEVDSALLGIFESFFDAGGVRRPKGLYGFPGEEPGTIPRG